MMTDKYRVVKQPVCVASRPIEGCVDVTGNRRHCDSCQVSRCVVTGELR